MIIIFVGGIGSGKTVSAVREIVRRQYYAYTNFRLAKYKNYTRLKWEHLVRKEEIPNSKKIGYAVNYDYWRKQLMSGKQFDIHLDELQEVMSSRRSTSKQNVLGIRWISQIRKVLAYNEQNNLYLITQRPMSIDIQCRELAHMWIYCEKVTLPIKIKTRTTRASTVLPLTIVRQYMFLAENVPGDTVSMDNFRKAVQLKAYTATDAFIANTYYRYYDAYEFVDFGNEELI